MKKLIIIFISLVTVITATSLICLFIRIKKNQNESVEYGELSLQYDMDPAKADDEFSENIINTVGDAIIYRGKRGGENLTQYEFVCDYYLTEEDAVKFSHSIAENADIIKEKTQIMIGLRSGSHPLWAFTLDNTSNESLGIPDYDGFYRLRLSDYLFVGDPDFMILISSMEGIRKLETTESFMKTSEENGIDWYEVWPDLEEIVILPDT